MHKNCECCNQGKDVFKRRISENITKIGWSLVGIIDGPFPFTYSIGASSLGLPEIIITGLPYQSSGIIINNLLEGLQKGIYTLSEEEPYDLANSKFSLYLKKLNPHQIKNYMIQTFNWTKGLPFLAYQLVYPDPMGLYPWESGYNFPGQKLLYLKKKFKGKRINLREFQEIESRNQYLQH
jgi:hypothetical protein